MGKLEIKNKKELIKDLSKEEKIIFEKTYFKCKNPIGFIEINNNIKSNNIDKVIDYLFFILDFYDKLYNSKWIKSIGEFYGLMSLILFLNSLSYLYSFFCVNSVIFFEDKNFLFKNSKINQH